MRFPVDAPSVSFKGCSNYKDIFCEKLEDKQLTFDHLEQHQICEKKSICIYISTIGYY